MPAFEWNKIIASVLTAMIVAMVSGILASQLVRPTHLEHAVYLPPGAEGGARGGGTAEAAKGPEPIEHYLAKADPAKGQQIAKVCLQCHTFRKGEPNKIGPNLFGVFGGPIAEDRGGYEFSPTRSQKHKGAKWTPDNLNVWLHAPQDFAQGTKMSFPGLEKVQERANVIVLETLTRRDGDGEGRRREGRQRGAGAEARGTSPACTGRPTRARQPTRPGQPTGGQLPRIAEIGGAWPRSSRSWRWRATLPMRRGPRSAPIFAGRSRLTTSPTCRRSPRPTAPPRQ